MGGEQVKDESQSEIDLEAATAEISSELFPQEDSKEVDEQSAPAEGQQDKSSSEGRDAPSADAAGSAAQSDQAPGDSAAPQETPGAAENSAEVQALGAPKTWNKEELATWATIPQDIQAKLAPVLARREEDFLRGITQYKEAAEIGQSYQKVVQPYAPILAAEGVDPVQLFQSFAGNHYLLSRGTPQQKAALAASLIEGYQIPLADLLNHIAENGGPKPQPSPEVVELRRELDALKGGFTARQQQEQSVLQSRIEKEVADFAADPAHPYFNELAADIQKLFDAKLASSLPEAYEKALYANPTTRQKEIDRLTAEKASVVESEAEKRRQKVASSTGDQVTSIPKSRNGTVPKSGSIDDTLNETMAAITARG